MSATVAQKVDPLMASTSIMAPSSSADDGLPGGPSTDTEDRNPHQEQTVVRKKAPMKKVTFDLELEIHTIPQRIPIYEKRPASHASYPSRGQHPQAFLPRPLDLRGKDRHLLGTTSARKIIDMFNLPSAVHNYPFSPKIIGRSPKRTTHQNASTLTSYPPTNSYPPRHPRMSRAAFNLKQLTSALGENFDESVYEWDYTARARKQIGGSAASMASVVPSMNNSKVKTTGNEIPTSNRQGNAIAAFSPSRIKTSPIRSPTNTDTLSIDKNPNAGQAKQVFPPSYITSGTPHLSSTHLSLNNRSNTQLTNRRQLKTSTRRTSIESDHNSRTKSPTKDRASSRCSTIDTYVIAEVSNEGQTPERVSPRSGSLAYRRKLVTSPNKKTTSQMAWETPTRITPDSSLLSSGSPVGTPRSGTVTQQQPGPGQPQWEVLARPATLSSTSSSP